MALDILDGNGDAKVVKTTLSSSQHIPFNVIEEISGSSILSVITALNEISSSVKTGGSVQTITASYANPIPITGSINVDVQISDLITVTSSLSNPVGVSGSVTINNTSFVAYGTSTHTSNVNAFALVGPSSYRADVDTNGSQKVGLFGATGNRAIIDSNGAQLVTSSNSAPVYVSASLANPVGITGSATVNNLTQTNHNSSTYSGLLTPIGLVGSTGNRTFVDSSGAQLVTSSNSAPVYVSASLSNPVGVTGSTTINNLAYTSYNASTYTSNVNAFTLVGSSSNRADVDASGSQKIGIFGATNNRAVISTFGALSVTSSNANPVFTTPSLPTSTIRKVFSTSDSTINFNDLTNLGSFQISANDTSRKGLLITNPTSNRLFISIATQASSSTEGRNGFNLPNNNNDPDSYSFIIYPSGSYFADVTNVTQFYGGFFVSSSNQLKVLVTETY